MTNTAQVITPIILKTTHNRHTNTKDAMILFLPVTTVQEKLRLHIIVQDRIYIHSSNSKVNINK